MFGKQMCGEENKGFYKIAGKCQKRKKTEKRKKKESFVEDVRRLLALVSGLI